MNLFCKMGWHKYKLPSPPNTKHHWEWLLNINKYDDGQVTYSTSYDKACVEVWSDSETDSPFLMKGDKEGLKKISYVKCSKCGHGKKYYIMLKENPAAKGIVIKECTEFYLESSSAKS